MARADSLRALRASLVSPLFLLLLGLLAPSFAGDARAQGKSDEDGRRQFSVRGWTSLFDGKSLDGWVTQGGRYDGKAVWTVEDGALVGREGPGKAGGLIYTEQRYRSFVLSLETKIDYPFDSGVFVHMRPEAKGLQVTLDHRPGGEIAGIYSEGWLHHNPEGEKLYRKGEWNRVELRCTGIHPRVQVWINGALATDWTRRPGLPNFALDGLIGLQVHGNRGDPATRTARFRDIWIRELPTVPAAHFNIDPEGQLRPTRAGKKAGWRNLLAKGIESWSFGDGGEADKACRIRDGVLEFPKEGADGYIRTKESFGDFELRMDFRIAKMANSGLFLRGDVKGGNPAYSGCEVQILDDFNWEKVTGSKLKETQFTGSLYGAIPPGDRTALHPLGRWNSYQVLYRGSRLRVELNGRLLYDVDTHELEAKPAFAKRAREGFIGLQRHAPKQVEAEVYAAFRNIWVRELPKAGAERSGVGKKPLKK